MSGRRWRVPASSRRIRTFLGSDRPRGPAARLSGADVRPGKFRAAMELSILGHHFRRVANSP